MPDFMDKYLAYSGVGAGETEAPVAYHRWTCASIVGALLGRQAYLPFGHSSIYPNQYIMLMGSPGTRKGTALNIGKHLLKESGFMRFAADRVSKERFLSEMKQFDDNTIADAEQLEALCIDEPAETYIMAGEFTDFIGPNNMEFVTMLTNLWDNLPSYSNPKITSKSIEITKPTVNLMGGNTAQGFSLAFPPEALGNGFLSRLLLVYGEPTGIDIPWPCAPDDLVGADLVNTLKDIKNNIKGEFTLGEGTRELGSRIYSEYKKHPIEDGRFQHYNTRRYTHLLKLTMIFAACDLSMKLMPKHMLRANTMLDNAERQMPKALGEFGKAKNSDVANTIVAHLQAANKPMTIMEIFKIVANDVARQSELNDIMTNLIQAEKIKHTKIGLKEGYVPHTVARVEWSKDLILSDWLTLEELS